MKFIVDGLMLLFMFFGDFIVNIFNRFSKGAWYIFFVKYRVAYVVAYVAYLGAFIPLLKNLYDLIMQFINIMNSSFSAPGSEPVNVGFAVLRTVGFFDAFANASSIFLPVIFAFFGLVVFKAITSITKEKVDLTFKSTSFLNGGDAKNGKDRFKGKRK